MPNPTPAEYTVQLGPTVTPEVAGELAAWAALSRSSVSKLTRWQIEAGLEANRAYLVERYGPLPTALLAEHVAEAVKRGERQVSRRRDYDDRTRTPAAAVTPTTKPKRTRAKRTSA